MKLLLINFISIMLTGVSSVKADVFVRDDIITRPTPSAYSVCYDHDCNSLAHLSLKPEQWNNIKRLFSPRATSPAHERELIAGAIAQFENMSGKMTGTNRDIGGTFPAIGEEGQLDCIDESINTTTYLRMLASGGLLKWHTVEDRAARGLFIFQWPHSSAVIRDTHDNAYYVVDSWFHDNGRPPEIVPLDTWKRGWKP